MKDTEKNVLLNFWYKAHLGTLKNAPCDLSYRQVCILMSVCLSPAPLTVRELSARIGISKPAVTRAVTTLSSLSLVRRKRDERDRRSVYIQRTAKGTSYTNLIAGILKEGLRDMVKEA